MQLFFFLRQRTDWNLPKMNSNLLQVSSEGSLVLLKTNTIDPSGEQNLSLFVIDSYSVKEIDKVCDIFFLIFR